MLNKENIKYSIDVCGEKVKVNILWEGLEKVKYASYLKKNEECVVKTNYQDNSKFEFVCENGVYNIVIFVKDVISGEVVFLSTENIKVNVISVSVFAGEMIANCLEKVESLKIDKKVFLDEKELNRYVFIDVFELISYFSVSDVDFAIKWIQKLANADKEIMLLCAQYANEEEKNKKVFSVIENCRKENVFIINPHQILSRDDAKINYENKVAFANVLKKEVTKIQKKVDRRAIEKTEVAVKLINNNLCAEIRNECCFNEAEYYFYLIKDGELYKKSTNWSKDNKVEFELSENGMYCVQGYIKVEGESFHSKSHTREYFTEEYKNEFARFLQKDDEIEIENPDLYLCEEPFGDFVIIQSNTTISNEFETGFKNVTLYELQAFGEKKNYLLSNTKIVEDNEKQYVVSGMIYDKEKILYGNECISVGNFEFQKHIGMYCIADIDANRIHISTDYFNFNRIFYYCADGVSLCSNRYHMLLLTMKNLGIKGELDEEKAALTLSSAKIQFLTQNTLSRMDIKDVYKCPNSYDVVLDDQGFHLKKNEYGDVLQTREIVTEDIYREKLLEGCKEIIQNVGNMLKDKKARHIICDLSGGLDSRAVYGAILHNSFGRDKVGINSYEVKGSNDLEVAIKINNLYGLNWEEEPVERKILDAEKMDLWQRSFYMGTYYSHNPIGVSNSSNGTVKLAGACGEILLRPYIVRKYFETNLVNIMEKEKFLDYILRDYSAELITDYGATKVFVNLHEEEFENYGVCSNMETIDRIYLEHRHAYHFDQGMSSMLQIMNWYPLQSKTLFKLHHNIYDNEKSIKLQLDVLNILDPYLAAVEFDSSRDNLDKEKLKDILYYEKIYHGYVNLNEISSDRKEYDEAMRRREKKIIRSMPKEVVSKANEYKSKMLSALRYLCDNNVYIKEKVGIALYYFITRNNSLEDRDLRYLYNKMISLKDQMTIFE